VSFAYGRPVALISLLIAVSVLALFPRDIDNWILGRHHSDLDTSLTVPQRTLGSLQAAYSQEVERTTQELLTTTYL